MKRIKPHQILRLDYGGGLIVGLLLLALAGWLRGLFAMPPLLYFGIAGANLAYGCFSLWIARRPARPVALVATLAGANAIWGILCGLAVVFLRDAMSIWGLAHVLAEGLFVFWLAGMEWRHRHAIAGTEPIRTA